MTPLKANQSFRNDRAEVGVGTLIVFIAMVLVAAVAAAVLINTTGVLQQRAQATGKDATQEVSSNLKVLNVYGKLANSSADVNELDVHVMLSAGAQPMDITKLIIRYSNGVSATEYTYLTEYQATWIRGSGTGGVMESGDLVQLHFVPGSAIAERTDIEIALIPEFGSPVSADFRSPATYGDNDYVTLR